MISFINPIPYAVPVFIVAILAEIIWTNHQKHHQYKFNDTVTCLSASIISTIIGALAASWIVFAYVTLYRRFHLIDMYQFNDQVQIYCVMLLVVIQDFLYYWFHRMAHRVNLLWASHIAHHSSEEYNFAVALRQSSFQQFFAWPIYLPLAVIGFPPEWLAFVMSMNLIYQFWSHTREIDRLPRWIEAIFNTPSHHRVHHGSNPQYLDKNYGGIFIIWDRIFGTFEPEMEEVHYGITVPIGSYNPLWVNVHYFVYLWKTSMTAPDISKALYLWFAPPDWKLSGSPEELHPSGVLPR